MFIEKWFLRMAACCGMLLLADSTDLSKLDIKAGQHSHRLNET
jgi:hypothetical protein